MYVTDEEYRQLLRYWREQTEEQYFSYAVAKLLQAILISVAQSGAQPTELAAIDQVIDRVREQNPWATTYPVLHP